MAEPGSVDLNTQVDNENLERWATLPGMLQEAKLKAQELRDKLAKVNSDLEAIAATRDTSLDRNTVAVQRHDLLTEIRVLDASAKAFEAEHQRLTMVLTILSEPDQPEKPAGATT